MDTGRPRKLAKGSGQFKALVMARAEKSRKMEECIGKARVGCIV